MFKEILKIIPKIDQTALASMERSLSTRFGRVAKKFGSGLKASIMGGGIASLALGLVDKLLNPLKEVQATVDAFLARADDISTNAKQFESTSGKLLVLQQLAKSTGLDEDALNTLLIKYQTAIAEAQADPTKQTSVRQFANDTDIVDSFYQFVQGLQKLDKNSQILVQKEIFGEKQILKAADFFQTDLESQLKKIKAQPAQKYTKAIEKSADLNDLKDALQSQRTLDDFLKKSAGINKGMVLSQNESEKLALSRENERLKSYEDIKKISMTFDNLLFQLEKNFTFIAQNFGFLLEGMNKAFTIMDSLRSNLQVLIDLVKGVANKWFIRGGGK